MSYTTEAETDHSQTEASGHRTFWNTQGTRGRLMAPHLSRASRCFRPSEHLAKGCLVFGHGAWDSGGRTVCAGCMGSCISQSLSFFNYKAGTVTKNDLGIVKCGEGPEKCMGWGMEDVHGRPFCFTESSLSAKLFCGSICEQETPSQIGQSPK